MEQGTKEVIQKQTWVPLADQDTLACFETLQRRMRRNPFRIKVKTGNLWHQQLPIRIHSVDYDPGLPKEKGRR